MERKPIETEEQYKAALSRIYKLMGNELMEGSDEENEVDIRSLLVKKFELIYYPMPKPKPLPQPLQAIKNRTEQLNMTEPQLAEILGYRSRKSEILSCKRKLSLAMIRKIHDALNIPAEVLIQAY